MWTNSLATGCTEKSLSSLPGDYDRKIKIQRDWRESTIMCGVCGLIGRYAGKLTKKDIIYTFL